MGWDELYPCKLLNLPKQTVTKTILDAMSKKLCLKWNEWKEAINSAFGTLRNDKEFTDVTLACDRVAEVAREHGWHLPKSLDSDENFKPEHTLFCRELRFVAIYALFFGDLWA